MSTATRLRWVCQACDRMIWGDTGYAQASYSEINGGGPVRWQVTHDTCMTQGHGYWIAVVELRSPAAADWWTSHLAGKEWYARADWRAFLERAVGYDPPGTADTVDAGCPREWKP